MIPHLFQNGLPILIILMLLLFSMIASIHLYDQSITSRYKVYNIVTYHMLSKKLYAQVVVAQLLPQDRFCKGCILSIFPCKSLQQTIPVR